MYLETKFSVAAGSARKLRIFIEDLCRATRPLARLGAFFKRHFVVPLAGCDGFAPFSFPRAEKEIMSEKLVKCRCQHCSGKIEFDAGDFRKGETRNVECPHCHLDTILFVPQSTTTDEIKKTELPNPEPKNVIVEIKRGVSPLGIASLVTGIVSILFCWIPFLGLFSIPIAAIGFLLAVIGITISCVSKKTGFIFSISGGIVCIISIFTALAITGGISTAISADVTSLFRAT
jgi:DNA-directed RNA polymerase subunit RPC12/RpoP